MEQKTNLRLRVRTNKMFNLIVAIQPDKTVRELAHRILNCYIELVIEYANGATIPKKRDLQVSSIKFQDYFISKEEVVGNILRDNDPIECILVKAKPKYPKQSRSYAYTLKQMNEQNTLKPLKSASQTAINNQLIEAAVGTTAQKITHEELRKQEQKRSKTKRKNQNKKQKKKRKMQQKNRLKKLQKIEGIKIINQRLRQQLQNNDNNSNLLQLVSQLSPNNNIDERKIMEEQLKAESNYLQHIRQNNQNQQGQISKNVLTEMQYQGQLIESAANQYQKLEQQMNKISKFDQWEAEEMGDCDLQDPKSPSFGYMIKNELEISKRNINKEEVIEQERNQEINTFQKFSKKSQQSKILEENCQKINIQGEEKQKEKQPQKLTERQLTKQKDKEKTDAKEKQKGKNKQKPQKVERIHSIMSMLFETVEGKKKRNKKDQKDKQIINKEKQKQNQRTGNRQEQSKTQTGQLRANNTEITNSNKIASPKVTFHSSPAFAPQQFKLASPQRKFSNPTIQVEKFQLEQNLGTNSIQKTGQLQYERSNSKPKERQHLNPNRPSFKIEQKTPIKSEIKANNNSNGPKVIVEQESQAQSQGHAPSKQSKTPSLQRKDNKLAQINQKLHKYGLQLMDLSEEEAEQ